MAKQKNPKSIPQKVRTRMAPSPTGLLHIGTARTTLFNYLFARKEKGSFIMRIEDTDLERSSHAFEKDILEGLAWLGLSWDEGPIPEEEIRNSKPETRTYKGEYGPYRQSERLETYEKYLRELLDSGKAFYCSHSQDFLESEKKEQISRKETPKHACGDRDKNLGQGIIRFKNDATGEITFSDIIRGAISFKAGELGDFSLAKNLAAPLYNFAVVVDDEEMQITHVIRGEDHISNTPKQILIQRALGLSEPIYAHLPLILGPDRSKMSKRHGTVSITDYKEQGYLPEALINFVALLGWHPTDDREIFSLEELGQEFSLDRVQKSGAVFDIEKLQWINAEHIRRMPVSQLTELILPYLLKGGLLQESEEHFKNEAGEIVSQEYVEKVAELEQPRLKLLSDIKGRVDYFFKEPAYDPELLRWKGKQEISDLPPILDEIYNLLSKVKNTDFSNQEGLKAVLMPFAEEKGRGEVLWPLRALLSGLAASPDPFQILSVLGKSTSLKRIKQAREMLVSKS